MKYVKVFIIFLIIIGFLVLDILSNKPSIRDYCSSTKIVVDTNQDSFAKIVTDIFDQAKSCGNGDSCKTLVSESIFKAMPLAYFDLMYPESTYFIRASNEGLIEKMFLSGEYYAKTPETFREKFVLWRLNQSKGVCDLGWKNDISTTSMTYLRDITAEAEVIVPIRKTNSAIVRLWGD
jgi:hypothetical protein